MNFQDIAFYYRNADMYFEMKFVFFSLSHCSLTHECCADLAKALASEKSIVTDLDLSDNNIRDEGMKRLCIGLKNPNCTIEILL